MLPVKWHWILKSLPLILEHQYIHLQEQYLSQSALEMLSLRDDKDNQFDFIAEGTQAHIVA